MFAALAKNIFGSSNDRYVRSLRKYVDAINGFEPTVAALTDDELRGQTDLFRRRLEGGTGLDDLLPEAFATVRGEFCARVPDLPSPAGLLLSVTT